MAVALGIGGGEDGLLHAINITQILRIWPILIM